MAITRKIVLGRGDEFAYNGGPMVQLTFTARCGYTICPHKWTYRLALGLIESWPNLEHVADFALRRGGYGNTDSGFGLEYPTRADRAGQLRFWRWHWRNNGRVKVRKYHFPEADYLTILVALLRRRGFVDLAQTVVQSTQSTLIPLPDVQLLPVPDPYDLSNYSFNGEFTHAVRHCMHLLLDQRDFALAAERAAAREGFSVADGSRLVYLDEGTIRLFLPHGHLQDVPEDLYLHLLETARQEVERWKTSL